MSKIITLEQAMNFIQEDMTLMVGGFLAVGTPEKLIDALVCKGTGNLTVIANDTGFPDKGVGKLVASKQLKKAVVSHIGTNPETGRQMLAGELAVELIPQGTLAEQIRSGGAGLGGFLTPTGVGTVVADGKQTIALDGKDFLLEKALRAEVALLKASKADKAGNLQYHRSARNFNPLMAMAATITIVQVDEIVEAGEIDPDSVMTPGIVVNWIVKS